MEGFLEANHIVEISLAKLSSRRGNLPIRKTLLITQVLNRTQDKAQDGLLSSPHANSRCSSKLLASFGHDQSDVEGLPASPHQLLKPSSRGQNPISIESHDNQVVPQEHSGDEPMDFDNVTSFLGDMLQDIDSEDNQVTYSQQGPPPSDDICLGLDISRPVSPGKRNFQQAFPLGADAFALDYSEDLYSEDLKRFKSCNWEASSLQSVPGFCGYLSSKNLQTAPFITYMFGRGFTHPSNTDDPNTSDWPTTGYTSELVAPLKSSIVSPILAF